MGLKGVPGIVYLKPSDGTNTRGRPARGGSNNNAPKRGRENDDQNARPSRRTAHQGVPGSTEEGRKPKANPNKRGNRGTERNRF